MNFFGHAAVAGWFERDPRWILGSMLPDFASMSRARITDVHDPVVAAGVALHHRTDDVFHGAPGFIDLQRKGLESLENAGVGRGASRAVAHVGVEMLIDGLLLDDETICGDYLAAIHEPARLGFRRGEERFAALRVRLPEVGLPADYRSPSRVTYRLQRLLASRPRLAFPESDGPKVTSWLEEAKDELESGLGPLLAHVREGLGAVDSPRGARAILAHHTT